MKVELLIMKTWSMTGMIQSSAMFYVKKSDGRRIHHIRFPKESAGCLSWQVSILKQELTEDKLIYSSAMQDLQSKVAELTEER